MLLGNIAPALLISLALGLESEETSYLIQVALVMSGLATLVQAHPIGPIGGRLPMVMGTSIVFMSAIIAIARRYNLATAFGACLVAACVELVMAYRVATVRKLFPPLVSAIVVMLIGLTLVPIGMDYAAGGVGARDYGGFVHLALAGIVLVVTLVLNQGCHGFVRYGSILVAVIVGYAVGAAFGLVSLEAVQRAQWLALPRLVPFGLELHLGPILLMMMIYAISAVETIGDISAVVASTGRNVSSDELRGGLMADGAMSGLASLVGAFPNTSFSQNVGLVAFTGVASRHVTTFTGIVLVALGLVPKVSAVFTTIPNAVVGGAGLIMFAMIFSSGVAILHRSVELTQRNMVILAVAIALGLGVELRPAALQHFPEWAQTFFGSGLIAGGLSAAVMNAVFPERD
jgi:NCS2 family nucleobase:cation symporter-2